MPAAPPTAGESQVYEITSADSGRAYRYPVTSRFTVILDRNRYPPDQLRCEPRGILGGISNLPSVAPPRYAARYEGVQPGTCTLRDGDFHVTITITPGQ